jgi:hypothetical protein
MTHSAPELDCIGTARRYSTALLMLVIVSSPVAYGGGSTSACSGFYAPGFTLVSGKRSDAVPSVPKPVRGQTFAEPTYGTCMVRATDHVADRAAGFTRNDYSRRQAFNIDNSRFIVYTLDGSWWLYDAGTYAFIKNLSQLGGDAEAQWHPANPDLLYYLPTNGGLTVNELNVVTGQSRVVGDFRNNRLNNWLPPGAAHVWTKSEGSPSADGRYWAFMVESSSFAELGFIVWDLTTDTIVSSYATSNRPDHLSMSPTGNYVVVSWDDGVTVFDRDFTNPRLVSPRGEHSDIALDANGDDVYVSVDYQANDGTIYMSNLRTGMRTDLFPTYLDGGASAFHFSGKAFNKPGWVLISSYADSGPPEWLYRKVFIVKLSANPTIYNLAHTHEIYNQYWTEPHASVSRDFTRILFNSNWDVDSATDVDAYMIEIPVGVLDGNYPPSPETCLFLWAESQYSRLFPGTAVTQFFAPYNYRYYAATDTYLANNTVDLQIWGIFPTLGLGLTSLGPNSTWFARAQAAGCR